MDKIHDRPYIKTDKHGICNYIKMFLPDCKMASSCKHGPITNLT